MSRLVAIGSVLVWLHPAVPVGGQAVKPVTSAPVPSCLNDEQQSLNKKLRELNRPTTKEDPEWIFDPDYFLGSWDLEWEAPESVLGSAGTLTGRITFKHVDPCYYEGDLQGKGPDGGFRSKIQFLADPTNRWMTWIEADSRGFTLIKSGRMGGDLGGYFTHFWEAPVFTYKGKKVRIKGTNFLGSPAAFRYRSQISVDGSPYENFGTAWFRKDLASGPPKSPDR